MPPIAEPSSPPADLLSWICDAAGCNLLVSDSFALRCVDDLIDLGSFPLRGVSASQRLWTVLEAFRPYAA